MRQITISLAILFSSMSLNSQVVYSLSECIKTGLDRNYSLQITRNNEEISSNNFTPGNAGYLPSVDLTSRHSGTLNNSVQNLTDGTQTSSNNVFNTTSNAGIALGLTIFNGFNVQTTYKKLGELKNLGELNTQMAIENMVADITSAYFNYIQQVNLLKTLHYAIELSRERLRIDQDRYLLGSGSKLQVLQSQVYLNSDSSRLSKQYEFVKASQIRLNELMSVENLDEEFTLSDTSIVVAEGYLYEKLHEETMQKNTSLLIATGNKIISEYDYKLVISRSYPYLNLSSGYTYNYNTFSSSATRNQNTYGMNYGLTLGVNLFDGFNQRRAITNSSIDVESKELRYLDIEQGVKADLLTIYSAYTNYLRLIKLEEQNLKTASENLEIAMERYRLGNLSGIDLREVQKSFLSARETLVSVQYQAKTAEISLLLISGGIMNYF